MNLENLNTVYRIECQRLGTTYFGRMLEEKGERTDFQLNGGRLISVVTSELRRTRKQNFLYKGDSVITI